MLMADVACHLFWLSSVTLGDFCISVFPSVGSDYVQGYLFTYSFELGSY